SLPGGCRLDTHAMQGCRDAGTSLALTRWLLANSCMRMRSLAVRARATVGVNAWDGGDGVVDFRRGCQHVQADRQGPAVPADPAAFPCRADGWRGRVHRPVPGGHVATASVLGPDAHVAAPRPQ